MREDKRVKLNQNYANLRDSYLFKTIAQKVNAYKAENPEAKIIRLGIGDVTRPLVPAVVEAMGKAVVEMGDAAAFRGYDDGGVGYDFLLDAIAGYYKAKGVTIGTDEIIVSDGAKSDVGNIPGIFAAGARVLIPDPVYPAYVDTNLIDGNEIIYIDGNESNGFLPSSTSVSTPPALQPQPNASVKADLIYICSPNNPTGAVYDKKQLQEWVDYALRVGAVILFDAAYESFITDKTLPRSIFEIDGARRCAIEICSFSKLAGFTGVRCGFTVVPRELLSEDGKTLLSLWKRRQTTKFNGVSYITQRGAQAALSDSGLSQCRENIAYYQENARIIGAALTKLGIKFFGGVNAPYIWLKCPDGRGSWEYFDYLLNEKNIVSTPGAGFGKNGDGFLRLTSFGTRENTIEAAERL
ncbi:MAG: LL-diaminopimelate aminotransferase [Clostridiales Family XIII bacterium]|jgi:LL-diaminopimelate aminotransferase|nr:LL-diaminopimelate aminotransferase [Clostridiales Family XIII bacterium]